MVVADTARFCEVFINIGTVLDGGGIYFLPRLVGMAKAKGLTMLGDEFSGKEAASTGLVYQSVAEADLDSVVLHLAAKLAAKEKAAISLIKKGLEASYDMTLCQALEWEAAHQTIMLQTKKHKTILKKFQK